MIMRWLTTSSCIPTSAGVAPYNSYNWRVAAYLATISISIHLHYWLSRKFTHLLCLDFALAIKSSPGHAPRDMRPVLKLKMWNWICVNQFHTTLKNILSQFGDDRVSLNWPIIGLGLFHTRQIRAISHVIVHSIVKKQQRYVVSS